MSCTYTSSRSLASASCFRNFSTSVARSELTDASGAEVLSASSCACATVAVGAAAVGEEELNGTDGMAGARGVVLAVSPSGQPSVTAAARG